MTVLLDQNEIASDLKYCKAILPGASRTFAISINHLRGEMQLGVMSAYLICRIADTVEDAPNLSLSDKMSLFGLIKQSFDSKQAAFHFEEKSLALTGEASHLRLCANLRRVLSLYHSLGTVPQKIIKHWVIVMIGGMEKFCSKFPDGIRIRTLKEYRNYCFFVAGTVGHLLTDLWSTYIPELKGALAQSKRRRLKSLCEAFGNGLQSINILKDIASDAIHENNIYLPESFLKMSGSSQKNLTDPKFKKQSYAAVMRLSKSAKNDLLRAFAYYLELPRRAYRVRLFCLVPLLFAFGTLREILRTDAMLVADEKVKISKSEVKMVLVVAPIAIFSNRLSRCLVARILREPFERNIEDNGIPATS